MKDLKTKLELLESWIRSGNIAAAQKSMDTITKRRIPRAFAKSFANIARRIGHHRTALKILSPVVRSSKPIVPPASPEEKLEYAITLARCGLHSEAAEILKQPDVKTVPDAALYQAFVLFSFWDYAGAIPHLKRYITDKTISSYQKQVGQVNLALAYTIEKKTDMAEKILGDLLQETESQKQYLLLENALEIGAMLFLEKGELDKAKKLIERAKNLQVDSHYRYSLYLQQAEALLEVLSQKNKCDITPLLKTRDLAFKKHAWELVRDCDLRMAHFTQNSDLFFKVYFGTPTPLFRERARKLYFPEVNIPSHYDVWIGKPSQNTNEDFLDINRGAWGDNKLKPGQVLHRLLATLAEDSYRPKKLEMVFASIFRGEHFDYALSPTKVHGAVKRLRVWLKSKKVPLEISVENDEYFLSSFSGCRIRLTLDKVISGATSQFMSQLKKAFKNSEFSTQEIISRTGLARSSAKRQIEFGVAEGLIEKKGIGKQTKYRVI